MNLKNRNAIITGASQGLGKVIARMFVENGANVMLCARSEDALVQTCNDISGLAKNDQKVLAQICDVSDPESVKTLVQKTEDIFHDVHILVNNAGVYGPLGRIEDVDWAQWAHAVAINLHGTVLMCRAILPHMRRREYGKIINLSGGGATSPLPRITAYAASKAAVVRFTESLALEAQGAGIDVNSVAPGALDTRLLDKVIDAGAEVVGEAFHQRMLEIKARGGTPMEKGASLCVYLASGESDGVTGKLISAVWDPWLELANHKDDLATDIYTLRRIIPKERGMNWGEVE